MKTRLCEICKEEIDPERIEVIPETRLCTQHAIEIRTLGGEFVVRQRVVHHLECDIGALEQSRGVGLGGHVLQARVLRTASM